MGQYYVTVFLSETGEFIRMWMNGHRYGNGVKLMEHSWMKNKFVAAVEHQLSPQGMFYKSRLVWAGDYADEEPDGENLYMHAHEQESKEWFGDATVGETYRYIINHTKRQYVDKNASVEDEDGWNIHPLPLLTAEGNGRGGGDYRGSDELYVGEWARDVISVDNTVPDDYTELECNFRE